MKIKSFFAAAMALAMSFCTVHTANYFAPVSFTAVAENSAGTGTAEPDEKTVPAATTTTTSSDVILLPVIPIPVSSVTTSSAATTTTKKPTTTTTTSAVTTITTATTTKKNTTSTTTVKYAEAGPAAGDLSCFDGLDVDNSEIKPILSLSRIELTLEEAKADPTQTIDLVIQETQKEKICSGIHLSWDPRLKSVNAVNDDSKFWASMYGENGVFLASTENKFNGVEYSFQVVIPSDCKPGDIYPIEIVYINSDIFINGIKDTKGLLMEAWTFTRGVVQGYIKIKDEESVLDYSLGDVDDNGDINAVDASSVLAYYARTSTNQEGGYSDSQKLAADVNSDDVINAVDASKILAYYAYTATGGDKKLKDFLKQ